MRVEGEMRSEEGGDGFNLSHQSTVSVSATWPGMGSLARSLSGELRGWVQGFCGSCEIAATILCVWRGVCFSRMGIQRFYTAPQRYKRIKSTKQTKPHCVNTNVLAFAIQPWTLERFVLPYCLVFNGREWKFNEFLKIFWGKIKQWAVAKLNWGF